MPRASYRRPGLGEALAWLRDRARLTQGATAEAAGVSRIYLQKLEAGERFPSPDVLDGLLRTLGSTREELEALLEARPWAAAPPRPAVRARVRARPEQFVQAAEAALAAAPWSSPIAAGVGQSVAGELAELRDHYLNLSRADQEALLAEARRRRFRS